MSKIPKADQVLIKVHASTITDVEMIRSFKAEDRELLMRECSGCIIKVGTSVTRWRIGDKVCALIADGRWYSDEEVIVSSMCVLRAPSGMPLVYAAGLPVVACNTYYAINMCLELRKGDILVIQGQLFDFTIYAIERAKRSGITVFAVGDDDATLKKYKICGADVCINTQKENIVEQVLSKSGMKGADAVLSYGSVNVVEYSQCMAKNGVILLVWDGTQSKPEVQVSIGCLTSAWARIKVCDIYSLVKSLDQKTLESLVCEVERYVWPDLECGLIHYFLHDMVPPSEIKTTAFGLINNLRHQKVILGTKELSLAPEKYKAPTKELSLASKLLSKASEKYKAATKKR